MELIKKCLSPRMLAQFFTGIYGAVPPLILAGTLQVWMREEGVNLKSIGIFGLAQIPYTLKFLWAPLIDRFSIPFFDRRRGWMALSQLVIGLLLFYFSTLSPTTDAWEMGLIAFFICFFGATQDITIDAYRRESLADEELGFGSTLYVNGYRIGMLIAGAGALEIAGTVSWPRVYQIVAFMMILAPLTTMLMPKILIDVPAPSSIAEAVIGPLKEYFKRGDAVLMLVFILFYKLGDSMASQMTMPMYIDLGFSKSDIARVAKGIGMFCTIAGGFLGGGLMLRWGINKALWIFGGLQMVSTFGFSFLPLIAKSNVALSFVIGFENLSSGMGTTAFVAFMASITDKRFTATQYALLTSVMALPTKVISAPAGYIIEGLEALFQSNPSMLLTSTSALGMGYFIFFILCGVIALPGLFFLSKFAPWKSDRQDLGQTVGAF